MTLDVGFVQQGDVLWSVPTSYRYAPHWFYTHCGDDLQYCDDTYIHVFVIFCLFICLFIYLFICLYLYISVCLSFVLLYCIFILVFVCRFVGLLVWLSYLFVYSFVYLSVYLFISACLFFVLLCVLSSCFHIPHFILTTFTHFTLHLLLTLTLLDYSALHTCTSPQVWNHTPVLNSITAPPHFYVCQHADANGLRLRSNLVHFSQNYY